MTLKVLHITISPAWQAEMRADFEAIQAGQSTTVYGLSFTSVGLFFSKLTENRWNLVSRLLGQPPMSIRGIARFLKREQRRVFDDVKVLGELGLLEKNAENLWFCPYDDVHIDMHLAAA